MFPVFIVFLLLKSKDRCQKKDKSHQAEQETMNQTSAFPAYDEVSYESAHHMVDKFSDCTWMKRLGVIPHAIPVSVWVERGQPDDGCRIRFVAQTTTEKTFFDARILV